MRITRLTIANFRNLGNVQLQPNNGISVFYGANGAGKTSVLEALLVLAKGRSFRSGQVTDLIGPDGKELQVVVEIDSHAGTSHRLGIARSRTQWKARRDGMDVTRLSEMAEFLPMVLIEPGSHRLVDGGPDQRRRFLDWLAFHVKPGFLDHWRVYQRALKQRNAVLKGQDAGNNELLEGLEAVLAEAGEHVSNARADCFSEMKKALTPLLEHLSPSLPEIDAVYYPGWSSGTLAERYRDHRDRDRRMEVTTSGPHRADIRLHTDGQEARARLSRGQQKALAHGLLLAQLAVLDTVRPNSLLLLDDIASEFDAEHLEKLQTWIAAREGQTWITGVETAPLRPLLESESPPSVFHVKQGTVTQVDTD